LEKVENVSDKLLTRNVEKSTSLLLVVVFIYERRQVQLVKLKPGCTESSSQQIVVRLFLNQYDAYQFVRV